MENRTINVSTLTFLKIIAFGLVALCLFLVKDILAMIFLAFVFASAIKPWVNYLKKFKIPKLLGITIIYIIFISLFLLLMILIIPPVSKEVSQLARSFPEYYEKFNILVTKFNKTANPNMAHQIQSGLDSLSSGLGNTVTAIFNKTYEVFNGFFTFMTILIIAFYFAKEEDVIKVFSKDVLPEKHRDYVADLFARIQEKLGYWFRGQLVLCAIIFGITFLLLLIFGVKYALMIAIIAGVLEIIPFFGPWISGIIGVSLAFTQSPATAFVVAIIFLFVQQAENSVIVPKIIGKSVGLNPLIVMIAILIGFQMGGIMGALISVPLVSVASVIIQDLIANKKLD